MTREKELLGIIGELLDMIDPDGHCENGCTCGECENCINLSEIEDRYYDYKNEVE